MYSCLIHNRWLAGKTTECDECERENKMNFYFCDIHGQYEENQTWINGCPQCSENFEVLVKKDEIYMKKNGEEMNTRKYLPTLSELIDRLTITQLKEVKIPEHKEQYAQEIADIVHDIQLVLDEHMWKNQQHIDAKMIRDIVVLAQMNAHIWVNETNFRSGIKDGNNLELSHGLNGIRNTAKNKIQAKFGGRKDFKVDNVKAFKDWVPSEYESEEK